MDETKRYFGNWSNYDSMVEDYLQGEWDPEGRTYTRREKPEYFPKDEEVLFAAYVYESYSGSAMVIWERDGKIHVDESGHCSCNGLEDSFGRDPEKTVVTLEALAMIPKDSYRYEVFGREAQEAFDALVNARAPQGSAQN